MKQDRDKKDKVEEEAAPKPRRRGLSLTVKILIAGLILFLVVGFVGFVQATSFLRPYYEKAMNIDLSKLDKFDVTTVFYDRSGREIGRLFVEDRILLDHDEIPDRMREAVLAVEDKRFYDHPGVDVQGLFRAAYVNMRSGRASEGGSTITQQLAKHLMGDFSKTLDRKAIEAFLALRIEKVKSKEQILDYYLNRIYFGKGYFGVGAAARGYFGKEAKDLSVAECAMLAGIVKSPNSASPRNNMAEAKKKRNSAIRRMANEGYITAQQETQALNEEIKLAPAPKIGVQSYFMALAVQELDQILGLDEEDPVPQGLKVITTQDESMQRLAEKDLETRLKAAEQLLKPTPEKLQAAGALVESKSGAIRVLIGGRDYMESPYDRSRMARRENGALLQPFLYALAFEKFGLHPASMVNASYLDPLTLGSKKGLGLGDPQKDLGKRFLTVQDALIFSNKAAAARTGMELGPKQVLAWLQSAGLPKLNNNDPATILDLPQLTLLEAIALYQMLGQGGIYRQPYAIEKIIDEKDKVTYEAKKEGKKVLDPLTAQQMALTLQTVAKDNNTGTLGRDRKFGQSVAGMSGYSEGYRDAWFVGFSPSIGLGTWMGYDKPISLGSKAVAAQTAVPLWSDMAADLLAKYPQDLTFPVPESLAKVEVDRRSGVVRGIGFLSPGAGNVFVYLKQKQLLQAQKEGDLAAAKVRQPDDWSDWLSTLYSGSTGESTMIDVPEEEIEIASDIPHVAEYRIPGLRGNILSAEGEAFATNENADELVLSWPSPDVAKDADQAVAWMKGKLNLASQWLGVPVALNEADLRSLYRFQRFHPVVVAERLSPEQSAAFPASVLAFEGFSLQSIPRRVYPYMSVMSQTIGYMLRKQGRNKKKYVADEVIYDDYRGAGGGLEQLFDSDLRGEEGQFTLATTPEGFTQATVVNKEPGIGNNVRTTINASVQRSAEKALATGFQKGEAVRSGAIVVIDPRNGDVLALASYPGFDPNQFIPGLSPEQWNYLTKAEKNPLMNKTYRQQHPPGSVFKVLTSLAAVQAGKLDADRVLNCPGYFQVGNVTYNLPKEKGNFSFFPAMARSVNTYFFDLGLKVGRDILVETGKNFGVGQKTGIILPDELQGRMPDPDFVLKTHKRWMGGGDVTNTSIGQGDVLMTPLQMANFMAAVANGGTLYKPRLVRQIEKPDGNRVKYFESEILHQVSVDPIGMKTVRDSMVGVVDNGTGRRMRDRMLLGLKKEDPARFAKLSELKIGAKTGTAQAGKKLATRAERQIVWIAGFAPAENPEIAFCVMIEGDADQDLHAGADAGPLAGIILRDYFAPDQAKAAQAAGGTAAPAAAAEGGGEEARPHDPDEE